MEDCSIHIFFRKHCKFKSKSKVKTKELVVKKLFHENKKLIQNRCVIIVIFYKLFHTPYITARRCHVNVENQQKIGQFVN